MRFDPTISFGSIMQAVVVGCGLVAWLVTSNVRSEQAAKDLITLQERLTTQITDLRGTLTGGLSDVRAQIATLPDQRAALEQTQRRMADLEVRFGAAEKRAGELERAVIETRADLNTLMRQTQVPLPRGRP